MVLFALLGCGGSRGATACGSVDPVQCAECGPLPKDCSGVYPGPQCSATCTPLSCCQCLFQEWQHPSDGCHQSDAGLDAAAPDQRDAPQEPFGSNDGAAERDASDSSTDGDAMDSGAGPMD